MNEQKRPSIRRSDSTNGHGDPAIRIVLLPRDTNSHGTIFGGIILSYIDMAGAVEAHRRTDVERFVTVAMREVTFHEPVFTGDLVSFYSKITRVGTTSITVQVTVEAERYGGAGRKRVRVTEAEVIYVAVDEQRQKVSIKQAASHNDTDDPREGVSKDAETRKARAANADKRTGKKSDARAGRGDEQAKSRTKNRTRAKSK